VVRLTKYQIIGVVPLCCHLHELIGRLHLFTWFTLELFGFLRDSEKWFLNDTCLPIILIFELYFAWVLLEHILYRILTERILLEDRLFLLMLELNFCLLLIKQIECCSDWTCKFVNLLMGNFRNDGVGWGVDWRKLCCVLAVRAYLYPSFHWFGRCSNLLSCFFYAIGHCHLDRVLL
jgi:hypothetical protein